jgi:hypothetical protein
MTEPTDDVEGQVLGDVDAEITRFRSAKEWAELRATDIDRYRRELGVWLEVKPTQ